MTEPTRSIEGESVNSDTTVDKTTTPSWTVSSTTHRPSTAAGRALLDALRMDGSEAAAVATIAVPLIESEAVSDLVLPVFGQRNDQRQSCKCCGTIDGIDFHVADDVWLAVAGPRFRDHVLCLSCFERLAEMFDGLAYGKDIVILGHQSWQAIR